MSAPADTRAPARLSAILRQEPIRPAARGAFRFAICASVAVFLYALAALVVFPEGDPSLLARLVRAAALVTLSALGAAVFRWGAHGRGGR